MAGRQGLAPQRDACWRRPPPLLPSLPSRHSCCLCSPSHPCLRRLLWPRSAPRCEQHGLQQRANCGPAARSGTHLSIGPHRSCIVSRHPLPPSPLAPARSTLAASRTSAPTAREPASAAGWWTLPSRTATASSSELNSSSRCCGGIPAPGTLPQATLAVRTTPFLVSGREKAWA